MYVVAWCCLPSNVSLSEMYVQPEIVSEINHLITFHLFFLVPPQTVLWLSSAPSVLEDCLQALSDPDHLKSLLQHHKCLEDLGTKGKGMLDVVENILSRC